MQKELKEGLVTRLDKYLSRESIFGVIGLLGLLESQAGPELWAIFTAVALAIFRGSKAFEKWVEYKSKTADPKVKTKEVSSVKDTQDKATDGPEFE